MSAAAQPADPERALAALERLHFKVADATTPRERGAAAILRAEMLIEGCGWLLPLARAGLRAHSAIAADADLAQAWIGDPCNANCSLNEAAGSPCECQQSSGEPR